MHGGHWKAQLRAQWEASRRRADAGAQTDALYADAGAQTTRPAYSDGGAQTLLGADDEDARPAPSYASDDDDALVARIAAPPASKVIAEPPALGKLVHVSATPQEHAAMPTPIAEDAKSAPARRGPPRRGAPAQTPATPPTSGMPTTGKGSPHADPSPRPTSSQNLHMGRSPPPPYAPPSPVVNFAPASPSASASSPSRKAASPPVPKLSALPAAPDVAPPPPRERLFIRIPARKRPPAPAPAVEPDLPDEQLGSPILSPASEQVLVQSPPAPVAGRKRPRSKEAASPAKRALTALDSHTTDASEPVAGPSRLAAPNGEHVTVESVPAAVRAKRQMKTAKSRVAPLPPPVKTATVASSATAAAAASSAAERAASSAAHPVHARARQWPSLSTALTPVAPASLGEGEPPSRTLSVAEALAAPTVVQQTPSAPPVAVAVEQARPLVPRKRTRSPSAERAPARDGHAAAPMLRATLPAPDGGPAASSPLVAGDALPGVQLRSLATASRLAHVEALHECIPDGTSDLPSVADIQAASRAAGAVNGAPPVDGRSRPTEFTALDDAPGPAATGAERVSPDGALSAEPPSANVAPARNTPPARGSTPLRDAQQILTAAGPGTALPPAPVARPKIKLRLKLPRAPSPPPARDKTESPLGLCFPSPPAPVPAPVSAPKPVPAELLAAFGGPGEEEDDEEKEEDASTEDASTEMQALRLPSTGRAATPVGRASSPGAARPAGERVGVEDTLGLPFAPGAMRLSVVPGRHGEQGARHASLPGASVPHEGALSLSPLQKSLGLPSELEIRAGIADAGTQRQQSVAIPRSPSARPSRHSLSPDVPTRADAPEPASGVSSLDVDMDMDAVESGAPSPFPAGSSATVPRAPSLAVFPRADSPAGPCQGDAYVDLDMDTDMDMGVGMDMTEADRALTRLASPPPAPVARKRGRTPLPDQRALSSPRRSASPASSLALALDSFHSPPPLQPSPSPHALRSSPAPSPAAGSNSGPMSPPWSPVALPDEMMQLLALGAGPLPMPVFEPLPPPPPDDDEDEVFGSDEDVERLLEGVPPPPPTGEKKVAKKRKRRASGKRKSRAVVGDSD